MIIISHLRVFKLLETVERKMLCLLPCTFLAKAVVYANDLGLDPSTFMEWNPFLFTNAYSC